MEILMSESTRDYGFIIITVVINSTVCGLRRMPRPDYRRMKECNASAYEQFQFELINEALENHFKGGRYDGF